MGGLGRQGPGRRGALVTWPRQRQETPIRPRAAQAFRLAPHPSRRIRRAASVAPHGRHRRRVAPGGTWTGATRGGSTRPRSSPCTMHMTCPPRPPSIPRLSIPPSGHTDTAPSVNTAVYRRTARAIYIRGNVLLSVDVLSLASVASAYSVSTTPSSRRRRYRHAHDPQRPPQAAARGVACAGRRQHVRTRHVCRVYEACATHGPKRRCDARAEATTGMRRT